MKKTSILLALIILFTMFYSSVWAEPDINSPTYILIDSKTGRVLQEKDPDKKMYPASTTKIMTAILCIEKGNLEDIVTIGNNPPLIERGSSQIYLVPGEQLTLEQLLYALMLESANDAAVAIAEHISGSVEEFAKLMNEKAKELGAINTNFVNPHGLPDDNHYTTSKDLAMIARYGMSLPKFREVVKTVKYTIPKTNKQPERDYITNSNKSIWTINKKYHYEYAIGIKTGYTMKAKNCFVSGAQKDGMELISVLLGLETSSESNIYTETKKLFEYGFLNYKNVELLKKNQIVTTVNVLGMKDKLNLLSLEDFSLLLSGDELQRLKSSIVVNEDIKRPIAKEEILGYINYSLDEKELKKIPLVSSEELPLPKKSSKWILYILFAYLTFRIIIVLSKHIKKNKRKKCRL